MPTLNPAILEAPAVQSLSTEDRTFLTTLLTGSGSIAELAKQCGVDLLTIAERLLNPAIQAALSAIEQAAARLSRLRAALGLPTAIDTLAAATKESNQNLTERRRAASALLGYLRVPREAGYLHAPPGAPPIDIRTEAHARQSPPHIETLTPDPPRSHHAASPPAHPTITRPRIPIRKPPINVAA